MLTGRPPFLGDTISDTVAVVLEREPNWTALPADTPIAVRHLIERCLIKDPKRRLRDIGDAKLEIESALDPATGAQLNEPGRRTVWTPRQWIPALVAAAVASGVAVWFVKPRPAMSPSGSGAVARLVITPPAGEPLATETAAVAISPDGRRVAYVAGATGRQ